MPYVKKNNPAEAMEKPFAKRLRALMENENDLSPLHEKTPQSKLAEYVGVSRQAINAYTLGISVPDINKLNKIADFFKVSGEYLLGRTDAIDYEYSGLVDALGLSQGVWEYLIQNNQRGDNAILNELFKNMDFRIAFYYIHQLLSLKLKGNEHHVIVPRFDFETALNNNEEKMRGMTVSSDQIKKIYTYEAIEHIAKAIKATIESLEEDDTAPLQGKGGR